MGALEHVSSRQRFLLNQRCLIGRANTCHWVDCNLKVSAEHALISYKGAEWTLKDLSSTNGIWQAGQRCEGLLRLQPGSVVSLGDPDNAYRFVDDSAPAAWVHSHTSGEIWRVDSRSLLLPNDESPQACVIRAASGWIVEIGGIARPAVDGEVLSLSSGKFRIELPRGDETGVEPTTPLDVHLSPFSMRFLVSSDEERVSLDLSYAGLTKHFEHRSYSYLLLTLARKRLADQASAFSSPAEEGWSETRQLAKDFMSTPEQLNLWVWRARRHLESVHPDLNSLLVERRPSLGLLRLGSGEISVENC